MKRCVSVLIILYCSNGFSQNIATSSNRDTLISYGGQVRLQYFYVKNENWGEGIEDNDGYILTRWLAHGDFRSGKRFRAFAELQSSLAGSRISPSAVDDNPLEVHQAFIEVNADILRSGKIIFKAGRQELMYGSQRLVSAREGPNNRQSFDAVKSTVLYKNYKADVFYGAYVIAKPGVFDDRFSTETSLWGIYIAATNLPWLKNVDLYYLGLRKRDAVFDEGQGKERRHSVGTRIWRNRGSWQYDAEGLCQFGRFADRAIFAWTASLNTTYTFSKLKLKPEFGLKTELISGDRDYNDGKLQTFNPLFPKGAYFGLAALIGPANLVDVHPTFSLSLSTKLKCDVDLDVFWRYSRNDGLYGVNMSLIYSGKNAHAKYIGSQLAGSLVYQPVNFLYFRGEVTWFMTGDFLKIAGPGKHILFAGVTSQIRL